MAAHTVAAGLVGLVCTGRQEASREGYGLYHLHSSKSSAHIQTHHSVQVHVPAHQAKRSQGDVTQCETQTGEKHRFESERVR